MKHIIHTHDKLKPRMFRHFRRKKICSINHDININHLSHPYTIVKEKIHTPTQRCVTSIHSQLLEISSLNTHGITIPSHLNVTKVTHVWQLWTPLRDSKFFLTTRTHNDMSVNGITNNPHIQLNKICLPAYYPPN